MGRERGMMFGFRLTKAEKAMLEAIANDEGVATTDVLRQLIRSAYLDMHSRRLRAPAPRQTVRVKQKDVAP